MGKPIAADNSAPTVRQRGKPFQKGFDARRKTNGNPNGRPRKENSIIGYMREFAAMSPVQLADYCEVYAKELRKHPGELPIAGVIAVRALMGLMDEPQPGMFGHILDRLEGTVKQQVDVSGEHSHRIEIVYVDDWRAEANQVAETAFGAEGGSALEGTS